MTKLQFLPTAEGYVNNTMIGPNNNYNYVFNYTDHLGNIRLSYGLDENNVLKILEENNYYPFGLKHSNYNVDRRRYEETILGVEIRQCDICPRGYQYKYNGKELQDELGLNFYDYGARNYDAAIGRWMNIDNMAEKYISASPYHYAGNNPVLYLDVDGNEFTSSALSWVNKLIADINSRQANNNKYIDEYKSKIANGGTERQLAKWNRNINDLNANNTELETVRGETATLAASDQVYDVQSSNSLSTENSSIAGTGFNFSNGRVVILMPSNGGMDLFSHELKHAYQFEIGESGFLNRESLNKGNNFIHDKTDEVSGYNRGKLFGGKSYGINNLPEEYKNLPSGPLNAVSNPQISNALKLAKDKQGAALQNAANSQGAAFRVDKKTYYKR